MYPRGRYLWTVDVHFRCRRCNPHRRLNLYKASRIKERPDSRKYLCAPFKKINIQQLHKPICQTILDDVTKRQPFKSILFVSGKMLANHL